jgi:hypothetical protein
VPSNKVYPQFTVASYFTVLSVAIQYSIQWQDDRRSGRSCGLTEVLSQCSPAGTQENHKRLIRTASVLCVIWTKHLPNASQTVLPLCQPTTQWISVINPYNPFWVLWHKRITPKQIHLLWQRTLYMPHQHVRDDKMMVHKDMYASYIIKHTVFLWTNVI